MEGREPINREVEARNEVQCCKEEETINAYIHNEIP